MAQLLSGTRIYGTGTIDSQLFVSGSNAATSTTTGALQVVGGMGVGGDAWHGGNLNFAIATNKIRWQTMQLAVYEAGNNGSIFLNSGNSSYPGQVSASQSVVIGGWSAPNLTGQQNTMVGFGTGYTTSFASGNTFVGASAGYSAQGANNAFFGAQAGAGSGASSIAASVGIGYHALWVATGNQNVGLGYQAGSGITTGAYNVVIGGNTGTSIATLSNNILLSDGQGYLRASWDNTGTLTQLGQIKITDVTNASSTSTGALQVSGGAGIAKDLWVGGTLYASSVTGTITTSSNAVSSTNIANGTAGQVPYQTAPGATSFFGPGTAGNVLVSNGTSAPTYNNTLTLAGTTTSISTATGALQVRGGAGIAGNLYVGGDINLSTASTNLIMGNSALSSGTTNLILGRNSSGDAATIKTYAGAATNLRIFNGVAGYHFELASYATNGWGPTGVNDGTRVRIDGATGDVKVLNTSSATSTVTGALQVVGGVGIGGNLYVGGTINASITGVATTATTLQTDPLGTNAIYYPTFVNSTLSNTKAFYTTSTFGFNPSTGAVTHGNTTTTSGALLTVGGGGYFNGTVTATNFVGSFTGTISTATNVGGGTVGQVHFQSAPNTTAFAGPGTSGQLLVSAGASATGPVFTNTSTLKVGYATNATNLDAGAAQSLVYQSAAGTTAYLAAGISGYLLQTNGNGAAPSWVSTGSLTANNANSSTNIIGGTVGQVHFQSAPNTTAFAGPGTSGQLLVSAGASATGPVFTNTSTIRVGYATNATNVEGGTAQSIHYQSAVGVTAFLAAGTAGQLLQTNGAGSAPTWFSTGSLVVGSAGNLSGGTAQSIVYQSAAGTTAYLAAGGAGSILQTNGTGSAPTWLSTASLVVGKSTSATNIIGGTVGQVIFQSAPNTTAFAGPGTSGQLLVSAGASATGPVFTNTSTLRVGFADVATNVSGGTVGQVNFQSAANTTAFAGPGTAGQLLVSAGASATGPVFTNTSTLKIGFSNSATNVEGGTAQSIHYQSAAGVTAFLAAGTAGQLLQTNGAGSAPTWFSTSSLVAGSSSLQQVVSTATNASFYPTFVSANNATPVSMPEYTTSSFVINPSTGNIGIGGTTPASNPKVALYGGMRFLSNESAAATYTGIGSVVTDTVSISTAGTEKIRVDSNGNVNVGVTPTAAATYRYLDVQNLENTSASSGADLRLITYNVAGTATVAVDLAKTKSGGFSINNNETNSAAFTAFGIGGTERMRINATGNVGIGLTNPTAKLHVVGTSGNSTDAAAIFTNGTTALSLYPALSSGSYNPLVLAGDQGILYTAGTIGTGALVIAPWNASGVGLRMDSGGNIGLGTSAPKGKLHIAAGATAVSPGLFSASTIIAEAPLSLPGHSFITFGNTVGGTYSYGAAAISYATNSNVGGGFGDLVFGARGVTTDTYPPEKLRIVGQGSRVEVASNTTLLLKGNTTSGGLLVLQGNQGAGGEGAQIVMGYGNNSSPYILGQENSTWNIDVSLADFRIFRQNSAGTTTVAMYVTETNGATYLASLGVGTAGSGTTGEIRATNEITAYYTSDARLKENVKLIENPVDKLNQIRGVYFDWTEEHIESRGGEDGYFVRKHDIGVIAQEVEAILPEIVATRDNGYKAVKYEKIIPLLIEAIKDQQKQINQIQADLDKLLNK